MTESIWPTAQQLAKINQTALKETKNTITKDKIKNGLRKSNFQKGYQSVFSNLTKIDVTNANNKYIWIFIGIG